MNKRKLAEAMAAIVGKNHVLSDPIDCFGYSYDSSPEALSAGFQPDVVVKAFTTEHVSQVLAYAHHHKIPVTTRGIGSGRSGGSIPTRGGIVLSLDEMNRILEIDEDNMMVTTEPGVRTKDLFDACAKVGLFYPPDPSSHNYSTIGGNIAENAGGMRAVKYGVTSAYVMALEVVLADGRVIECGGKMIKNVTGYNLVQLFVGSEGTLGVITKATLKLLAMPKYTGTAQVCFESVVDASAAVSSALSGGLTPSAAEIMDKMAIDAAERFLGFMPPPDTEALILFDVDGPDESSIKGQLAALEEICRQHRATGFIRAQNKKEADALWQVRRKLSSAVAAMAPDKIGEDISVPRNKLPEMVQALGEISKKHRINLAIYGHAGDGNMHPAFLCDLSDPDDKHRLDLAIDDTFKAAVALGGTLSGEHGIGISKRPWIRTALSADLIDASLAIKEALDPHHILNPDKIF